MRSMPGAELRLLRARGLLSSGDGLAVQVVFWAGELGSCELCLCKFRLGELEAFFLGVIVCVISTYTPEVLAIDVDEAANGKQRREYVGHN